MLDTMSQFFLPQEVPTTRCISNCCSVPEMCLEPTEALNFFTTRFEVRYGAMHPLFFIGGLKEAVREATSGVGNVRIF